MQKIKRIVLEKLGIINLKKECTKLKEKYDSLKEKIKSNKLEIKELKKKYDSLLQENKNVNEKLIELNRDNKELEKRIIALNQDNKELVDKIDSLYRILYLHTKGINETNRPVDVIVSLTSFPERIPYVHLILERMLMQTVRPDKIVLWLSKEQFPNLEKNLPDTLLDMRKDGVEIEWCEGDMKAYKKFLPALKKYPEDLIIIIDDDMVFEADFIEKMYEAHLKFPEEIIASRVHQIGFEESGEIAPYMKWKKECDYDTYRVRDDWFLTGGAGTLFPPGCFGDKIFNEDIIREICPHADDIWLNIHAAISRRKIVNIATNKHLPSVKGTQVKRLWDINMTQNDVQIKQVMKYYHEELRDSIYDTCKEV